MDIKDKKVIVGLSGGVDSSVAAAILVEQGCRVTGVTMKTWGGGEWTGKGKSGCYGPDEEKDIEDARKVAAKLSIPFHVIDLVDEYKNEVLDYFCREYLEGRTPNPCVYCNRQIKFGALLDKAAELGIDFDYFATGHYARVEQDAHGRYLLKRGRDSKKDQSYFLYNLTQRQLARSFFPLGNWLKTEVRKKFIDLDLGIGMKPESQNFVWGSYVSLFNQQPIPGPIMDKMGNILGEHKGIVYYTLGQRRKLGLASPESLYVIDIKPELNAVVVGDRVDLYKTDQVVKAVNWVAIPYLVGECEVVAKIRSTHDGYNALITCLDDNRIRITYREPQIAAARGQAIVFYKGDIVLGGGIVE
jgi:tRNA-specific 2-thiouridylase